MDKNDLDEQRLVDALQAHVVTVNKMIEDAMLVLKKENKDVFYKIAYDSLLKNINSLDIKMSALIKHQYRLAIEEKNMIADKYERTQVGIFIITALVLLFSLFLTVMIVKNFQNLLKKLTQTVEMRNKENSKMHQLLEKKVDAAVERTREQDQVMYQHARLSSMGEMIGNIAHQWRQPLNAITLLIQSFGTKSLSGKLDQAFIDKQVDEGLRLAVSMSNTIEDFRSFFSPSKEKENFYIGKSIHDTIEMSSFFVKDENIDVQVYCDKDIKIYGYANEFSQVILNLINNARENFKSRDIKENKKIEIVVKEQKDRDHTVTVFFSDNGGGIEEHIIDKVFEPYFTTKHQSSGTGIGLYMSKQIIEVQMSGEISVQNIEKEINDTAYKCAEFKIVVPV